jgi:hypothetical protein
MVERFFYKGWNRNQGRSAVMHGTSRHFYRVYFFRGECVGWPL